MRLLSMFRLDRKTTPNNMNVGDIEQSLMRLDQILHDPILRILTILAPSLYTLSLYLDCRYWVCFPIPSTFPLLVELSIKHPFTAGTFRGDSLIALQSCPRLRRLVLTGFNRVVDLLGILDNIQTFGPKLAHFCVPSNAEDLPFMVQTLKQIQSHPSHPRNPSRLNHNHSMSSPSPRSHSPGAAPSRSNPLYHIHSPGTQYISDSLQLVFPIFFSGTQTDVFVDRVWDRVIINQDAVEGSEARLMWERMWVNGISGEGDGFWR
jgi:hypothetical protein